VTTEQAWLGVTCAAVTASALVALVLAARARRRAARAEALVAALVERVDLLESRASDVPASAVEHADAATFVITRMDSDDRAAERPIAQDIDGRLFADIVARETVVKAASWTHGLRRALSPANRNRIRFEVRQETRRAARERRSEAKQALREYRARMRSAADSRAEVREDVA
jgi:hypothetical protein